MNRPEFAAVIREKYLMHLHYAFFTYALAVETGQ